MGEGRIRSHTMTNAANVDRGVILVVKQNLTEEGGSWGEKAGEARGRRGWVSLYLKVF